MEKLIKPIYLKRGDTIGVVSSSAPLAGLVPHRLKKGLKTLEDFGFKVKIGSNALKITKYTAGNEKERAQDINNFFKDKTIKAIFSFIGGNHSNQILKYLDYDLIKKNPKIFIGYSDTTVLHFALYSKAHLVTFYGPAILTQFAENPQILKYTKDYFEKAVMSKSPIGRVQPSVKWTDEVLDWFTHADLKRPRKLKKNQGWQWIKKGKAEGQIIGGCLPSMIHLRGTDFWPDFSGKILFWETSENEADFAKGESISNIDSYLTDLELSGVFDKIKGMIIGRPFGCNKLQKKELITLITERMRRYNFPILFNVDVGHTDPIITIPLGIKIKLDSHDNLFEFQESGVS